VKLLGLIPARSGSKGIPHKNIRLLGGKPLIAWAIEAGQAAGCLVDVLLSTDSPDYLRVGREYGLRHDYLRPPELAAADTPMAPVMAHAAAWYEQRTGQALDGVCLLQPTSPCRTAAHIAEACRRFAAERPETLVSVVPVPHNMLPQKLMREVDGLLVPLHTGDAMLHRHQPDRLYARNGPLILIVARALLDAVHPALYGVRILAFKMSLEVSLDLDTEDDWQRAERLLRLHP